jgi:hypothetical protein
MIYRVYKFDPDNFEILSKSSTKYFDISSVMGSRPETQKYDIN